GPCSSSGGTVTVVFFGASGRAPSGRVPVGDPASGEREPVASARPPSIPPPSPVGRGGPPAPVVGRGGTGLAAGAPAAGRAANGFFGACGIDGFASAAA